VEKRGKKDAWENWGWYAAGSGQAPFLGLSFHKGKKTVLKDWDSKNILRQNGRHFWHASPSFFRRKGTGRITLAIFFAPCQRALPIIRKRKQFKWYAQWSYSGDDQAEEFRA